MKTIRNRVSIIKQGTNDKTGYEYGAIEAGERFLGGFCGLVEYWCKRERGLNISGFRGDGNL